MEEERLRRGGLGGAVLVRGMMGILCEAVGMNGDGDEDEG